MQMSSMTWPEEKSFGSCVILFSNVIPAYPLGFHHSPLHIIPQIPKLFILSFC